MENALSITILIILCIIAFRFPPGVVFIFALTSSIGDGFGVGSFLKASGFEWYENGILLPVLISVIVSVLRLYRLRKSRDYKYVWKLGIIILCCIVWVLIADMFKLEKLISVPADMFYSGLPLVLVAIAYFEDEFAKGLFVALVFVQLLLAAFLVLNPSSSLSVVMGKGYNPSGIDLSFYNEEYTGGIARLTIQMRLLAQFANTQLYGLYAVIGISCGLAIVLRSRRMVKRVFGICLLIIGGFGWTVTGNRGTTIGFLLGLLLLGMTLLRNRKHFYKLLFITGFAFCLLLVLPIPWDSIHELFLPGFQDSGIVLRKAALSTAWDVLFTYPLFGIPPGFFWEGLVVPHQLNVWYAAVYGLPAGICITAVFVWYMVAVARAIWKIPGLTHIGGRSGELGNLYIAIILGFACLGQAMTNNFSAPALFWLSFGYSCAALTRCVFEPEAQISTISIRSARDSI